MNRSRFVKKIELFPASLLGQRETWRAATPLLPANTCLIVTDTSTSKQTELMRCMAKFFRNDGWQVLIWMPPNKAKNL